MKVTLLFYHNIPLFCYNLHPSYSKAHFPSFSCCNLCTITLHLNVICGGMDQIVSFRTKQAHRLGRRHTRMEREVLRPRVNGHEGGF